MCFTFLNSYFIKNSYFQFQIKLQKKLAEEFSGEHNPTFIQDEFLALKIEDPPEEINQQELGMTKTEVSGFKKETLIRKYFKDQNDVKEFPRLLVKRNNANFYELDGVYVGKSFLFNSCNFVLTYPESHIGCP